MISEKLSTHEKFKLDLEEGDILIPSETNNRGNPVYCNRKLAGQEALVIIGDVEEFPLSLKGIEIWRTRFSSVGQLTSVSIHNRNKKITIILDSKLLNYT